MNEPTLHQPEIDENLADYLGFLVRNEWIEWASEQPDVDQHPHWLVEWEDLPERDRDVDRRIGMCIATFVQSLALARMQQTVKLLLDQKEWEKDTGQESK